MAFEVRIVVPVQTVPHFFLFLLSLLLSTSEKENAVHDFFLKIRFSLLRQRKENKLFVPSFSSHYTRESAFS